MQAVRQMLKHPPCTLRHPTFPCLSVALLVLVVGCGPDRPATVPVSGVVTIDGQPPPGEGTIYFAAAEAADGYPLRPATAQFDASGYYETTTFEAGDGLIPGRYKIVVHCWQTPPNMDGRPVVSYIDDRYGSAGTSGLEDLEVAADAGRLEYDLDLQSSRP